MRDTVIDAQEQYLNSLLLEEGSLKKLSRQFAEELGLAQISISASEGQLIKSLIQLHGCKKFVEIGTLTGLSAQYIFEGLPEGGALWTLEKEPKHSDKAGQIFTQLDQASKKIHLIVGDARSELESIVAQGPFDGIFIDGNKAAYGDYLAWAEKNVRPGGLILADNVFLSGAVWGAATKQRFSEKQIQVMREFNQRLADPKLFTSTIVPTQEGLFLALKNR